MKNLSFFQQNKEIYDYNTLKIDSYSREPNYKISLKLNLKRIIFIQMK